MAEAEKLPSGNWRCRAYDNTTKTRKSFTAETKTEAEYLARQWLVKNKPKPKSEKTLGDCIDDYIALKENILSPTTVREISLIKNFFRLNSPESTESLYSAKLIVYRVFIPLKPCTMPMG